MEHHGCQQQQDRQNKTVGKSETIEKPATFSQQGCQQQQHAAAETKGTSKTSIAEGRPAGTPTA